MLFFKKKIGKQQPDQPANKGFVAEYKSFRDSDMGLVIDYCNKTGKDIYDSYMNGVYVTARLDGIDYKIETAEYNADNNEYYFKYRTEMLDINFNIFCVKIIHNHATGKIYVIGESMHIVDTHQLPLESK